jgi:ribosome-associated protein
VHDEWVLPFCPSVLLSVRTKELDMAKDRQGQDYITLQQVLKLMNVVQTGGQAKQLIQSGEVKVNSIVETRRRKKLYAADRVEVYGEVYQIGEE